MILYLVRHAQSTNNASGPDGGRVSDPALTELGWRQARLTAQHLAAGTEGAPYEHPNYNIDRLFCSPMLRSLQTARPIGERLGICPEVWVDVHEHGGMFEDLDEGGRRVLPGRTRAQIRTEFPEYVLPEDVTDEGWWFQPDAEDLAGCQARAVRVAGRLHAWRDRDDRIAIVSHGTFMAMLIKALSDQLPSSTLYYYHYNAAITRLDFFGDGEIALHYLNRIDHMPAEVLS